MKISNAIEKYLIASNVREETPGKKRKFYVSDMGKCYRMRWLKRKGIKTEFSTSVYFIFAMGNMIHDFGYKALEAQGLLLSTEEYVEAGEHFSGRYDGKVMDDGTKLPAIFDFKSASPYKIKKLEAGGDDGADDAMQVLTYVKFEKESKAKISNRGMVVYLNKDPAGFISPVLSVEKIYNLNLWEPKIDEDMDKMIGFWKKDKLPPCTCPSWMKAYNSFLPFCQMPEKKVPKYLKLLEKGKGVITTKESVFVIDGKKRKEVVKLENK